MENSNLDICRINTLSFNHNKTQFALGFDNGIIIYNTDTLQILSVSKQIGDIAIVSLLYELQVVVFAGSKNNMVYQKNKMVIYDNIKKIELFSSIFAKEVQEIQVRNKLILIETKKDISVFKYENDSNISFINKSEITFDIRFPFVVFEDIMDNCNIIVQSEKNYLNVLSVYIESLKIGIVNKVRLKYEYPQNLFIDHKTRSLFICDYQGQYISEVSLDNMHTTLREYYRGSSYGKIVDIQKMGNYCFITNCDKTIHIYSLKDKKSNLTNFFSGFVKKEAVLSSYIKIDIDTLLTKDANAFSFFAQKKGGIVTINESTLSYICYNGNKYTFTIRFDKSSYSLLGKDNWVLKQLQQSNRKGFEIIDYDKLYPPEKKETEIGDSVIFS